MYLLRSIYDLMLQRELLTSIVCLFIFKLWPKFCSLNFLYKNLIFWSKLCNRSQTSSVFVSLFQAEATPYLVIWVFVSMQTCYPLNSLGHSNKVVLELNSCTDHSFLISPHKKRERGDHSLTALAFLLTDTTRSREEGGAGLSSQFWAGKAGFGINRNS